MLKNLQEAHDAFVFGATYAALALMRSIMEAVLRDHYRADGKDLSERIRNPRRAYLQQAAVELSAEGLSWLGEQLQAAFDTHGKVPQDALDQG